MQRRGRRSFIAESNNQSDLPGFDSDDFDDCMARFLSTIKARNRSVHTIDYYRKELVVLRKVFEAQKLPTRLARINHDMIERNFIEYSLEVKGVKYSTVATSLRAYRAFFNWAVDRGVIDTSPMKNIVISTPR